MGQAAATKANTKGVTERQKQGVCELTASAGLRCSFRERKKGYRKIPVGVEATHLLSWQKNNE